MVSIDHTFRITLNPKLSLRSRRERVDGLFDALKSATTPSAAKAMRGLYSDLLPANLCLDGRAVTLVVTISEIPHSKLYLVSAARYTTEPGPSLSTWTLEVAASWVTRRGAVPEIEGVSRKGIGGRYTFADEDALRDWLTKRTSVGLAISHAAGVELAAEAAATLESERSA